MLLPAGDLRDVVSSSRRADIIIVTKCRPDLSTQEKTQIKKELAPLKHQQVFFTEIVYSEPYHLFDKTLFTVNHDTDVLLVCGIANPKQLKDFLASHVHTYDMLRYRDHQIFTTDDLQEIIRYYDRIESKKKIILTTEKDGVRLEKFKTELQNYPIYVLPISHSFLFSEGPAFDATVMSFVEDILW